MLSLIAASLMVHLMAVVGAAGEMEITTTGAFVTDAGADDAWALPVMAGMVATCPHPDDNHHPLSEESFRSRA